MEVVYSAEPPLAEAEAEADPLMDRMAEAFARKVFWCVDGRPVGAETLRLNRVGLRAALATVSAEEIAHLLRQDGGQG